MESTKPSFICKNFDFHIPQNNSANETTYKIHFDDKTSPDSLLKLEKVSDKLNIKRINNTFASDQSWKINKIVEQALALNLISSEEYIQIQKQIGNKNKAQLAPAIEEPDEASELDIEKFQGDMVEMSVESPFYDTDLVVLKDSYMGKMPLNGISEAEFKVIEKLYNLICRGSSHIKFEGFSDKPFIFEQIKLLLTRAIGREMVSKCALEAPFAVTIKCGARNCYSKKQKVIGLMPGLSAHRNIELHPYQSQRLARAPKPVHIVLAHELVHHLHATTDAIFHDARVKTAPSVAEYDNLEEELTITGFLAQQNRDQVEMYDKFNERAIHAAFVTEKHKAYPRFGHKYIMHIDMQSATATELYKYGASLYNGNLIFDALDFLVRARKEPTAATQDEKFENLLSIIEKRLITALMKSTHPWHKTLMSNKAAVAEVTKMARVLKKTS